MNKLNSSFVLGATLIALSGQAVAELRVVVTPTKTEKPVSEVNAQLEIITREEIDIIQPASTTELLVSRAGVEIGRNGGEGQQTSIFLRGAESDHTLVLIDGVNIAPDLGQAAIQNINPELIERIEIVKGARATQYGSHAIGGVINIITKKAKDGLHGEFSVRSGRYNTREANAGLSYGSDLIETGVNATISSVEGPSAKIAPVDEDEFENASVNAFAKLHLGQAAVGIKHFQAAGDVEYDAAAFDPITFLEVPTDAKQDFSNRLSTIDFSFDADLASISLTYSRAVDDVEQASAYQSSDFTKTQRDTFDAQANLELNESQSITTGVQYVEEELDANSFGTTISDDNDRKSVFAQYDVKNGSHQVLLSGRHSDYDSFGVQSTGGLEYAYKVDSITTLFASVANAFRAPSLTDRFGFGGNANLEPEKSLTREFGLRIGKAKHSTKLTLFNTDIENLISYQVTNFVTFAGQNQNINQVENRGLELGYDYASESINAYVDILLQSPENKATGANLLRRSSFSVKSGATYTRGKWSYGTHISHNGSRDDFGGIQLDSYTLLNASLIYRATANLQLGLSGKNIGAVNYQLANGFNQPDTAYYASAKLNF